jgi:hypothetical protein
MAAGYGTTAGRVSRVPIIILGLSLSDFFAVTFLLCLALLLVIPDVGLHVPWFQFLPGFTLSAPGILLGLVESLAYGWYVAVLFGWLFNFFAARA